ncbi:MAG: aminoacyl-tRNA hydrolase [Candidatus Binatia bacterium]
MWVIVGLGNPGAQYARTRHNAGFMVVDALAARWKLAFESRPTVRIAQGRVAGDVVYLVQPQTYMNRSGEAMAALPLPPDAALLAVYDDIDLAAGQLRIRPDGGTGGHRGVASLAAHLGAFTRLRIGIGRPPAGVDPADFVLSAPTEEELAEFRMGIERAGDAVECIVAESVPATMNRFNGAGPSTSPSKEDT